MTVKMSVRQTCVRTVKPGDSKFTIVDGMVVVPRAGFEITSSCPKDYRHIILSCIQHGWLKPVANVKDNEIFWEEFSK